MQGLYIGPAYCPPTLGLEVLARVRQFCPMPERDTRITTMLSEHGTFVARTLRNYGVPSRDIDDCVQRVFIVADRRLGDIRLGSERAFLFRSAAHIAAHARRSLARKREVLEEEPAPSAQAPFRPDELTERKQFRELLDRVLNTMSDDLRSVFVLHAFEELTMAEIAELLDIASGTVASRLRRARVAFRAELDARRAAVKKETA